VQGTAQVGCDILFETDVGSFPQTCSSSREPTSESFTPPEGHDPGPDETRLQFAPESPIADRLSEPELLGVT
jgi:hypothetical protein